MAERRKKAQSLCVFFEYKAFQFFEAKYVQTGQRCVSLFTIECFASQKPICEMVLI